MGAKELVLGASHKDATRKRWQRLLSPAVLDATMRWKLGPGPALRLVQHHRDEVLDLTLEVTSPHAADVLGFTPRGQDREFSRFGEAIGAFIIST